MKKLVIWDLFGGSQNSVYHALRYFKEFEVYTFDTNDKVIHDKQYICDLSNLEEFENLIKTQNIPKPDIIVASPMCRAFSVLLHAGKGERVAIKLDKEQDKYIVRDLDEIKAIIAKSDFLNKGKAENYHIRAFEGIKLLENTIKIIDSYNPKAWYIENPATSLMWDYIKKNCGLSLRFYHNLAHYNSYDLEFSLKPTIFFSNWFLNLKAYNIKNGSKLKRPKGARMICGGGDGETGARVKIPHLLIIEIIMKFKAHIEDLEDICKVFVNE